MLKSSNHHNMMLSKGFCANCVREKDCIALNISNYTRSIKTIHSCLVRGNDHVFNMGDKLDTLYVVKSGSIKTFISNQVGEEQILGFHAPGDILGLDAIPFNQYVSTAVALQSSSVCMLPLSKLEEAFEQLVPQWLFSYVLRKLKQNTYDIHLRGKKNANTRIATFLLALAENNKTLGCSEAEFDLNMSRDDIGNYLGLASETVSRTLTNMKKKGCVKLDRRHIEIIDSQRLHTLAEN